MAVGKQAAPRLREGDPGVVMVGGMDPEELEVEVPRDKDDDSIVKDDKGTVVDVRLNTGSNDELERDREEDTRLAYDPDDSGDYEQRDDSRPSRRQRRNANKRVAIQLRDRTIEDLTAKVDTLTTQLRQVTSGQQGLSIQQVEDQLRNAQQALQLTNSELGKAIAEADGAKSAELLALRDEANARVFQLNNMRNRMIAHVREQQDGGREIPQNDPRRQQQQTPQRIHPNAERFINTFMERFPYFDQNGGDEDSRIMKTIDDGVAADGYLAHTPEYWRVLERRLAAKGFVPESEKQTEETRDDGSGYERPSRRQNDSRREADLPPTARRGTPRGGSTFRLHPEMRSYLEQEGILFEQGLNDEQKARRNRLIDGWRTRSKAAGM